MSVKHGCPRQQQNQNMAKIFKSNILTPGAQGRVMSVKCEEPYSPSLVTGVAVAEWLSSWLSEQEVRGSIPRLAT